MEETKRSTKKSSSTKEKKEGAGDSKNLTNEIEALKDQIKKARLAQKDVEPGGKWNSILDSSQFASILHQ